MKKQTVLYLNRLKAKLEQERLLWVQVLLAEKDSDPSEDLLDATILDWVLRPSQGRQPERS